MPKAKRQRDPTNRERQARYHARMRTAGFVRINAWIHQDDVDRATQYLERLRRGHPF
jgi:hypothetical protein